MFDVQSTSQLFVELIRKVERVQRRATKFIPNVPFQTSTSYKDRLSQLNLLPLLYWHEYLDLVFFYKIINNLVSVDQTILPTEQTHRSTRNSSNPHTLLFRPPKCRTSTYQHSFIPRTCRTWNTLPGELRRRGLSLCLFKSRLRQHYHTVSIQRPPYVCVHV